eukprot:PhM_4_TR9074/c0_g1_i1/m.56420
MAILRASSNSLLWNRSKSSSIFSVSVLRTGRLTLIGSLYVSRKKAMSASVSGTSSSSSFMPSRKLGAPSENVTFAPGDPSCEPMSASAANTPSRAEGCCVSLNPPDDVRGFCCFRGGSGMLCICFIHRSWALRTASTRRMWSSVLRGFSVVACAFQTKSGGLSGTSPFRSNWESSLSDMSSEERIPTPAAVEGVLPLDTLCVCRVTGRVLAVVMLRLRISKSPSRSSSSSSSSPSSGERSSSGGFVVDGRVSSKASQRERRASRVWGRRNLLRSSWRSWARTRWRGGPSFEVCHAFHSGRCFDCDVEGMLLVSTVVSRAGSERGRAICGAVAGGRIGGELPVLLSIETGETFPKLLKKLESCAVVLADCCFFLSSCCSRSRS